MRSVLHTAVAKTGLTAFWARADSGSMGGDASEELVAALPDYEDSVAVRCTCCDDAADVEIAESLPLFVDAEVPLDLCEIDQRDLESLHVAEQQAVRRSARLSAVPFIADNRCVLVVMRSDSLLNPLKLARFLTKQGFRIRGLHEGSAAELEAIGATYDWVSLVRTPQSVVVVADVNLKLGSNYHFPSPRVGHFFVNLNPGRDFRVDHFADLQLIERGMCSRCGHILNTVRGVEIAHIFKLGTTYSRMFNAQVAGRPLEMACYGVGLTRLMAAVAAQHEDSRGLVWPQTIAPFSAILIPKSPGDPVSLAERLYADLAGSGIEVLLDDTGLDADGKSRRAAQLGIPYVLMVADKATPLVLIDRASGNSRQMSQTGVRAFLHDVAAAVASA